MSINLDSAKLTFSQEVEELLAAMEEALLSLEHNPQDKDLLQQVFRAMHTIKGTAGVFGYTSIVAFTHEVETVMDAVRSGARTLDAALTATLLGCRDHTAALVEAVLQGAEATTLDPGLTRAGVTLIARLGATPTVTARQPASETAPPSNRDHWLVALDFRRDALRNGMDPLSFLRYLGSLGEIVGLVVLDEHLPVRADYEPETCYLGFRVFFRSDADKKTIAGVFEFAEDDCDIRILPPDSRQEYYLSLLRQLPEEQIGRLGDMLVQVGALTEKEVSHALAVQTLDGDAPDPAQAAGTKPLGEILVARQAVQQPLVEEALRKQDKAREKAAQEARYIRVDAMRLGHLIDLVGELVIGSASMTVMLERHGLDEAQDVVDQVQHLVAEIRDNALQLRMVQIGETFTRFRRVVRDVSQDLGKDIDLVISGGETELDKTVVEKINDPLTHLIRNALDHGIESPQERRANGKLANGTVWLNAYHDSGHIVIQIRDDGAGLDATRIRAKAEAQGLVRPEQSLTREETLRLIFEPGLSTKDQASNLSGRGVGMDVVRRNIEALRGAVELESEPGHGTQVTIVLPLTLAIIDGFLVRASGEHYVIPLAQVVECVEMTSSQTSGSSGHQYINLRGEVLPYLRLKDFFQIPSGVSGRESLVVVRFGHTKAGLVVDELYGELQTVIKPLGQVFEHLKGIAGATVLGTGDIALILDVQALSNLAHTRAGFIRGRTAHA